MVLSEEETGSVIAPLHFCTTVAHLDNSECDSKCVSDLIAINNKLDSDSEFDGSDNVIWQYEFDKLAAHAIWYCNYGE